MKIADLLSIPAELETAIADDLELVFDREVPWEFPAQAGIREKNHIYHQFECGHRSVQVKSLWHNDKVFAVVILAGRGKDGGKAYRLDKQVFSKLCGMLLASEASFTDTSKEIDRVNGYSIANYL